MATAVPSRPLSALRAPQIGAGRQLLAGLLVAALTAGLTVELLHDRPLKAIAILIVVVGTAWFAMTRRTELALALWVLYVGLLDGYLKLSTGSNLVTFVRDILLYAICAGVLIRAVVQRRSLALPPLSGWVLAFVLVVAAQLANPGDGTLYHSLAGIRQELEFVPVFFLAAAYVRTKRALRWFVVLLLLIGAVNGPVSLIQSRETPEQLAAWGPGYSQKVLGTGGFQQSGRTFYTSSGQQLTRPFGLGSDAGDGGFIGAFGLIAAVALLVTVRGRRWLTALAGLGAIFSIVAVYTSQGRSSVVESVVILFAFAMLATTVRGRKMAIFATAMGLFVAFLVVQQFFTSGTATRYSGLSATSIVSTTSKARGGAFRDIPTYLKRYPFGAGLGVAGPASGTSGAPPQADNLDAENEVLFLVDETGIPGVVVLIGFTLTLFLTGVRRLRLEPDPETRVLLAAVVAAVAGVLALYTVTSLTPAVPVGPFLWGAGGVISYWLVRRPAELARTGLGLDPGPLLDDGTVALAR